MQMTIRMPDETGEKLDLLARKMGLKRSDIARMALKSFIEEKLRSEESRPYDRLAHVIGAVDSGITDLGQRHREHLKRLLAKDSAVDRPS